MYGLVSLFSGGGGLDLGLELTKRFRLLACLDASVACCETILRNRNAGRIGDRSLRVYQANIRDLNPEMVLSDLGLEPGELALLAGAPPCQSFSTFGRRGGVQDPRGRLIWDYLRFVERIRPKAFLMEQVPGLLSAALRPRPVRDSPEHGGPPLAEDEIPGSVLKAFLERTPAGYRTDVFVVNAVNYGVPQNRQRVIVIGNRLGRAAEFPWPTHGGPGQPPFRTLGDALAGLADPGLVVEFAPSRRRFISLIEEGGNWRSLPADAAREARGEAILRRDGGQSRWFRRLSFDHPCPTVLTRPYSHFTSLCHPVETRPLGLLERARVQRFPDDWEFAGSVDERFAQVGNAVPVGLATVCGQVVADLLDGIGEGGAAQGTHPSWRVVHLWSLVRTRWEDREGSRGQL